MLSLGSCGWVQSRHNLLITGPTGIGKSYLACAFVERACRRGHSAAYLRLPRLLQQLAVARGDGSYARLLGRLARLDLLAIDDWLLAPLRDSERRDLIEVVEDRSEQASTLVASQLSAKDWHAAIGDPNLADAMCDRLLHNAHRLELKGPSKRRTHAAPKSATEPKAGATSLRSAGPSPASAPPRPPSSRGPQTGGRGSGSIPGSKRRTSLP